MHVLRLNLHFDLHTDTDLPTAIRELANFIELSLNNETTPQNICKNTTYGAFYYNRSLGYRLTGSVAVCSLIDGMKWVVSQKGLVNAKEDFGHPDYIIIK